MDNKLDFKYFDSKLVDELVTYNQLPNESKSKEKEKELVLKVKAIYKEKDLKLKESNKTTIATLKKDCKSKISSLNMQLQKDLTEAEKKYASGDQKEYSNVVVGLKIACKRARIKEINTLNEEIKNEKFKRYDFHKEYVNLIYLITDKVSPIDSVRSSYLESMSTFNLKATLTNKKTWINLVPLFMLTIIIIAYFIGKKITGYGGDLTDIINNGIFVAVVATGAVFIYSQGGFDMSLGNASLMCAIVAAIVYNKTGNLGLSLCLSLVLGAGLGIINAILATMLNLPVMVMTLTMMNIISAVNEAILGNDENRGLININDGMIDNAWIYALFLFIFFILCWFIFNYTKVGRRNKFIGSNKVASKFNGINLMRAGMISFAISGVGLGICGFLFACSKSGSNFGASTVLGQVGLNVVIAIVFGGMTTSGGPKSKVSCAIIGAFFSVFLDEFFYAISTPTFQVGDFSFMVKGIVFIIVSLANMWDTRSKRLASGGSIQ